jgi:hypothetical protein
MRINLKKLNVRVVAALIFAGTLFLSVEKNNDGNWILGAQSSLASSEGGSEASGGKAVLMYNKLSNITAGVPKFASGRAEVARDYTFGIARVSTPSYTWRSLVYTKSDESSLVMANSSSYHVGFSAGYTTSGGTNVGTIDVMELFTDVTL